MNIFKKIYCRVFQTAFRLALPVLPYRKPQIVGSVRELPDVIRGNHCSCVLIVTDSSIRSLGLTKRLEHTLERAAIPFFIYDGTVANPTTINVAEALELYRDHACDAIIGFGGGSSMDCAKAVGACIARPKKTLAQMKGILKVRKKLPLLIAIPTTAGTGSETTLAAVITDAKTRHKYAINDFIRSESDFKPSTVNYSNNRNGCSDSCRGSIYWAFHYLSHQTGCVARCTTDL